jgi:hypothetical protein
VAIGDVLPPSDAAPHAESLQEEAEPEKPAQRRIDGALTSEGARGAAKRVDVDVDCNVFGDGSLPPDSGQEGTEKAKAESAFGGMGASEAGRKGAEKRWARERERSATADVTPAQLAKIVNALRQKAENGDVAASRELREWLRQAQDQGPAQVDVLQALSPEQRAIVRDWLSQSRPQ